MNGLNEMIDEAVRLGLSKREIMNLIENRYQAAENSTGGEDA